MSSPGTKGCSLERLLCEIGRLARTLSLQTIEGQKHTTNRLASGLDCCHFLTCNTLAVNSIEPSSKPFSRLVLADLQRLSRWAQIQILSDVVHFPARRHYSLVWVVSS